MLRIAINGFGRIGRMILRSLVERGRRDIQVVAVNDVADFSALLHLFKYDSTHGPFRGILSQEGKLFNVGLGDIRTFSESDPEKLPWQDMDIDLVMECTGHLKNDRQALKHIEAGAKKVLVSTISSDADITVVYGVNHIAIKESHSIISNASCTSNCLLSILYPLHKKLKVKCGHMLSVHAYTSDQCIVDAPRSELYRARAVSTSIIPSSTNAAKALPLILPELENSIHCSAVRVPILNVSLIDLNFISSTPTSSQDINNILIEEANDNLKGVLSFTDEPLVSIDHNHNPHNAVVDLSQTAVTAGTLCRVVAWYDNEWAFANRMCDVAGYIGTFFR